MSNWLDIDLPSLVRAASVADNWAPAHSIVTVHGLYGHRTGSWGLTGANKAGKRKTWLEALLPSLVPEARAMTFGYETGPGVISKTGWKDKARELLNALLSIVKVGRRALRGYQESVAKFSCF